jgi:alpha-L-fucosidase
MFYTPDPASLRQHSIPDWYLQAKFGIFIHWSLSAIPAYAPAGKGSFHEVIRKEGFETLFRNNPYREWYHNGLRLGEGPVWEHHRATWGADYPYERFKDAFNAALEAWDPGAWADAFTAAGARYVVGELVQAVRGRGMRMGLYYSGALDWTLGTDPIRSATGSLTNADPSPQSTRGPSPGTARRRGRRSRTPSSRRRTAR